MDYEIRSRMEDLESTAYIEIGPGKYSGKHWQPGFLFIWEDAFGMAEVAINKYYPAYDHFGINDIPEEIGRNIIRDWKSAAHSIRAGNISEFSSSVSKMGLYGQGMASEVEKCASSIASMLEGLSAAFEKFYEKEKWVCVLGV